MGWLIAALAALFVYVLVRAYYLEPHRLEVTHTEIPVPNLPAALDGFRIVHVSDLHIRGYSERERNVVRAVKQAGGDLLCLTGDYVHGPEPIQFLVPMLMEMTGGRRAYAVLGNHDHAEEIDTAFLQETLRRAGAHVLNNDAYRLSVRGVALDIVGVDDPHTGKADLGGALERLRPLSNASDSGRERFTLLLAHSPDVILDPMCASVDLILAGHTHGGQIRLPLLGALKTNTKVGRGAEQGLVVRGGTRMYVSRGLGETTLPLRFCCPPEVSVLTLRATGTLN